MIAINHFWHNRIRIKSQDQSTFLFIIIQLYIRPSEEVNMNNCQPQKCNFPTALYTAAEGRNCFIIPNEHVTSVL